MLQKDKALSAPMVITLIAGFSLALTILNLAFNEVTEPVSNWPDASSSLLDTVGSEGLEAIGTWDIDVGFTMDDYEKLPVLQETENVSAAGGWVFDESGSQESTGNLRH